MSWCRKKRGARAHDSSQLPRRAVALRGGVRRNIEDLFLERSRLAETTPLKRLGHPEDAVQALLYLLERADFVTGDVLVVDGGRVLR